MNTLLYCTAVIKLVTGCKTGAMTAMIYSIKRARSIVRKCLFVNLFLRLTKMLKSFIHQQMHYLLLLENSKIYIRTYIKIAPTCFGPRPSSGSLHLSLAKVTGRALPCTAHTPYLDISCCHTTA
jgi:hypothetical protein